jgi:hypothetical protein
MKKILIFIFINLLGNLTFTIETITAPFVSELRLESQNNKVLIQWKNPADFKDYLSIYRSNKVIDSMDKLKSSEKIILLTNQESQYIDIPPSDGLYYYAIIITEKASNKDNAVFVPHRNYSLQPVVIEKTINIEITKFSAESNESSIMLKWEYKSDATTNKKVTIYRNTEPITNDRLFNDSIKISSVEISANSYIDIPIDNINYYYAIFIENDINNKSYIDGINITTNPVSINNRYVLFREFSIDSFIPLPLLTLKDDPATGKTFIDPQILKNPVKIEYTKNVKNIIGANNNLYKDVYDETKKQKNNKLMPLDIHILNDEAIFETNDYNLEYKKMIDFLKNKKYDKALIICENLIKEILPDDLLKRISFYLGQLYYNKKNYYMSYIYLNYSFEAFKKETTPFLDSIYQNIFYSLER